MVVGAQPQPGRDARLFQQATIPVASRPGADRAVIDVPHGVGGLALGVVRAGHRAARCRLAERAAVGESRLAVLIARGSVSCMAGPPVSGQAPLWPQP